MGRHTLSACVIEGVVRLVNQAPGIEGRASRSPAGASLTLMCQPEPQPPIARDSTRWIRRRPRAYPDLTDCGVSNTFAYFLLGHL